MNLFRITIYFITLSLSINLVGSQSSNSLADVIQSNSDLPQEVWILRNPDSDQRFEQAIFSENEQYTAIKKVDQNWILLVNNDDGTIVELDHDNDVIHFLFSENSRYLVTIDSYGSVKSWDIETFQLQATFDFNATVLSLTTWTETLFIINDGATLMFWDSYSGDIISTEELDFTAIDISTDNNLTYTAILDDTQNLHLYEIIDSEMIPVFSIASECPYNTEIQSISFNESASYIYIACDSGILLIQSLVNIEETLVFTGFDYSPFVTFHYSTNVFPVVKNNQLTFVSLDSISNLVDLSLVSTYGLTHISYYAASSDGSVAVLQIEALEDWEVSGFGSPSFNMFDIETGDAFYFFGQTIHVQFSENDKYILAVTIENEVHLFQLMPGT